MPPSWFWCYHQENPDVEVAKIKRAKTRQNLIMPIKNLFLPNYAQSIKIKIHNNGEIISEYTKEAMYFSNHTAWTRMN